MWSRLKWLLAAKPRAAAAPPSLDIPAHERPLGRVLKELSGDYFEPLRDLELARQFSDAYVVMEGDWGGQIYLTAPVRLVRCTMKDLERLLARLDRIAWLCNEGEGCGVFFERHATFEGIPSGMGGGVTTEDVWLHPDLRRFEDLVRDVLRGISVREAFDRAEDR